MDSLPIPNPWRLILLDKANAELQSLLNSTQHDVIRSQLWELSQSDNPMTSDLFDVRPIRGSADMFVLSDRRTGIFQAQDVCVVIGVRAAERQMVVLGACQRSSTGKVPFVIPTLYRFRLNAYVDTSE